MWMRPEETVGLLLSRVTATCGERGTLLFNMGELRLRDTARASGLADQAAVHLQIGDTFATERSVLIAVRDHFQIQKDGWGNLEEFTEPGQLAACVGVKVNADGCITEFDLSDSGLTGEEDGPGRAGRQRCHDAQV